MGLIHENNIDNQPIEYVYRTPIKNNIWYLEGYNENSKKEDVQKGILLYY